MTDLLPTSASLDARAVTIELEELPATHVVEGAVSTGVAELGQGFGLWEHTVGVSTDVEADEVFVVVAGRGRVDVTDDAGAIVASFDLYPGAVARLAAGSHTVWTVTETLRKVWFEA